MESSFRVVALTSPAGLIIMAQVGQDTQECMVEVCVWLVQLRREMGASMETVSDQRTKDDKSIHDGLA